MALATRHQPDSTQQSGRAWLIGVGLITLVAAGCNGTEGEPTEGGDTTATTADQATTTTDGTEEAYTEDPDCFGLDGVEEEVECGMVTVPLEHEEPEGEEIDLAVAILPGEEESGNPLLILGGGPGEEVVENVLTNPQVRSAFDTGRETILLDQRGVGASDPALNCPNEEEIGDLEIGDTETLLGAYEDCREALAEEGVDLEAFNHLNNARDIEVVRTSLGHTQIDIRGTSYGTHLALNAAALDPDGVGAMVLSSPIDPSGNFVEAAAGGFDDALDRVFAACESSSACADEAGDVEASMREVVDGLADAPVEVTVESPEGEETTRTYTPASFLRDIFGLFYLPDGAFVVPAVVDDALDGDLEPLAGIVATVEQQIEGSVTGGMQASMLCTGEWADFDVGEAVSGVDSEVLLEYWFPHEPTFGEVTDPLCDVWGVEQRYEPEEFSLPESTPALIVTGELDHVTPAGQGEQVADQLDTAHLVEVPGVGHAPLEALDLFTRGCGQQIVDQFWSDPSTAPDTACVEQMPPFEPLGTMPAAPGS